jgi:hypothetical protein
VRYTKQYKNNLSILSVPIAIGIRNFLFCFLLPAYTLVGQDSLDVAETAKDSMRTVRYDSRFYFFDQRTRSNFSKNDTSFNELPNYFQRSLIGNIGLPDYSYLLSFRDTDPLGVKWFSSPYDNRLFGLRDDRYYWQKGIHTEVFGAVGSKKEQVLKFSHIQNINERLNFSLKLDRYGALGFYQFQQSFVNNVLFSSNYTGKKKRFGYFASFGFDRFRHQENGGITSDTSIVADIFVNKELLPVYLSKARRNYSLMTGNISLFFKLNRDSASSVNHYLLLGTKGYANKSQYTDVPDTNYYKTVYKDPAVTADTTKLSKLSPSFSYNLNTRNSNFELGGMYDWSHWETPDSGHYYSSIIALQGFAWRGFDRKLIVKERASYIASGDNTGDYQVNVSARYQLPFLQTSLSLKALYEDRSPDLFFNYNSSNNYYWKNAFDKTQTGKLEASIASDKLRLEIGAVYSTATNMIVLGSNALPVQIKENVLATRLYIKHHLKVYKFHLVNTINYQSKNSYALALPQLYTRHQLYFEHRVKKNGLKFEIGVQADYISKTDLISYDPALNSFYLKYANEQKGNYVFADFFFSVNFKPVKFFFKAEHLNQGFMGSDYTLLNGYYQPDRAFRLGVNWEFRD